MPSILGAHSVNCKLKKKISKSKMKLSKLKTFSKKCSSLLLAMTWSGALLGCALFDKSKPKLISETYCEKHFELENDSEIDSDLLKISAKFFQYVQINESTFVCECREKERVEQCRKEFLGE